MSALFPRPSGLSREAFVAAYEGVYESSPWVAEALSADAASGALDDPGAMGDAMREAVDHAGAEKQLALLRAHPELAKRAAVADLSDSSRAEQSGAGLTSCTQAEFAEFATLNERYNRKFDFPFIIAVTGLDRAAILTAFRARVENAHDQEFRTALDQVHRIAAIRLAAMTRNA